METKVTVDDKDFMKSLLMQRRRAINPKPILQVIAQDMQTRKDMNFRRGKEPNGEKLKPLSELTLDNRKNRKRPKRTTSIKPLMDLGLLRASYKSRADRKSAALSTNKKEAPVHQYGHTFKGVYKSGKLRGYAYSFTIPARPTVGITPKMRKRYNNMVTKYILEGKLGGRKK
jgi:phage gpG-like protein